MGTSDAGVTECSVCGEPTVENALRFVSCRLRCVRSDLYGTMLISSIHSINMMLAGSRAAKICPANSVYYKALDACIPLETSATSGFRDAFTLKKKCFCGTVETTEQLDALRFCEIIEGGLTISVNNASADFRSLRYISQIQGVSQ